ncbi:MAG: YihY family inner membrane protein [Sulfuricurvum sp.]
MLSPREIKERVRELALLFFDKDLMFYASSLSFYTIFSLIPLLLIVLNIFTSLPSFSEHYKVVQEFIFSNLLPANSQTLMEYIDQFLQNSQKMSMIGVVMIMVSSILFFQNLEYIANKIFDAKSRSFYEAITTFWTLITLAPFALGASFYITGYIANIAAESSYTAGVDILPAIPYLITWALFFLLLQILPNTKVTPKASAISSLLTSIVFSIAKNSFIYYIVYNKSYTTIYGSFSIILFLFLWIYVSWVIFVYAMKLNYLIDTRYKNAKSKEEASVK